MATKDQIINMALGHLGQAPTDTLDVNTIRDSVRKVLVFADMARDLVLGDHDWLEACVPVTLNPLSLSSLTGWANAYGLPEKFVRMSEVDGGCRWELGLYIETTGNARTEQKVLYSDSSLARARAVITCDWTSLGSQLALAVSFKMAWLAAISVLGNKGETLNVKAALDTAYIDACRDAARSEAFNHNDPGDRVAGFQDYRRLAI